jgi:CDP-diacylglycerol--serine O-phosphatidyltransferase
MAIDEKSVSTRNVQAEKVPLATSPVVGAGRSRSIYLLPNLFTTAAMLAGFYAIVCAYGGNYKMAGIAIVAAAVLDGFDGRVARMTNTTTPFGAEYDSMSDMVSFGVAPAFLVYAWSLSSLKEAQWGQLGWVIAFVFTACCALRLARFNVAVGTADKRFFQGLACPTAGVILGTLAWVCSDLGIAGTDIVPLVLVMTLATALLMVSNFAYYSFKDIGQRRRVPFAVLLTLVLVMLTTAIDPAKMILILGTAYAASGPAWAGWSRWRKRSRADVRE